MVYEDTLAYDPVFTGRQLPPPVVKAVNSAQRLFDEPANSHELYDRMYSFDDAIYTAIDMKGSLVRACYRGLYLRVGTIRTPEEEGLIRLLSWIEQELSIDEKFFSYGKKLSMHGDWVLLKDPYSMKPNLRSLPIKHLTIIENEDQLDNFQNAELPYQVFHRGKYVLNESNTDIRLVFDASQVIHLQIGSEGNEVTDTQGRFTYEVWGQSPLESLKTITLWKHNTILNDILIRHRIVPRELHGLNFEDIDENTIGTSLGDDKLTRKLAARQLVEDIMKAYEAKIVWKDPDQAYIFDKNASEISMLSPEGFSYAEPNEVIEQQNRAIARVFGIPISVFDASKGGSYASDIVRSSFVMVRTEDIARAIKKGLLEYIKEYIATYFPYYSHLLDQVDIRLQLVLDKDLDRLYKVATVMSQMTDTHGRPLFTPEEIREVVGKEPLTGQDYINMGYSPQPMAPDVPSVIPTMDPAAPNIPTPAETMGNVKRSNPQIIPYPKTEATKDSYQVT